MILTQKMTGFPSNRHVVVQNLMPSNIKMVMPGDMRLFAWMDHFMFTSIAFTIQNFFIKCFKDRISKDELFLSVSLGPV